MTSSAAIRVVVADDHPLFRDGLTRRISERDELELVGEAADGSTALAQIRALRPDVAVLDVRMPGIDGIGVAASATYEQLPTRCMMLTAFLDSALIYRALAAGACGYLSKDANREQVCDAIAAVARGEVVVPPQLQGGLAAQIRARSKVSAPQLTPREREVLALIASGASAPQIARSLHLSTGTVKTHLMHLYDKLGVSDRAAAVAEAMRSGLIE